MYKGLGYNPTTVNFKQTRNDSNSSASGMPRGRGNVREGRGNAFEIKLMEETKERVLSQLFPEVVEDESRMYSWGP